MYGAMAAKSIVVVSSDRSCVDEIIDGGRIDGAVMIPSVVQLNQHVGLRGVITDGPHKTTLGVSVHLNESRQTGVSRYLIVTHSAEAAHEVSCANPNSTMPIRHLSSPERMFVVTLPAR